MSTVSAAYASSCSATVTFTGPFVSSSDPTALINGLNETGTLTASSTVPATKVAAYELTLSSGAGTINLAALPGITAEETVNGTGLKVQLLKLKNKSSNANKITVAKGASNGYGLCASGDDWDVTLSPGQSNLTLGNDAAPDIASGARTLDVTGTGAQVLQVLVVMG